ncbi:unnamed protein product [Fraxinus pennsylvanica]|uniref:Carbohydrate kinase PfkB domain-containing protein n=1 Tax=Fraxinus pennsylvanica TaxID=56036 RepID=A0AAD1Z4P7_9LAMI|nr:unnamed protein product [Fraxinus pennsylvanica]
MKKAPGGAPANVAIAVARLGGKAALIDKLEEDEFGHMHAGILKENGVSAYGIPFDKGAWTALAFVTLRVDEEREFMFYRNPSANMLLTPDELNLELIRSALNGIYLLPLSGSSNFYILLRNPTCRSRHQTNYVSTQEAPIRTRVWVAGQVSDYICKQVQLITVQVKRFGYLVVEDHSKCS